MMPPICPLLEVYPLTQEGFWAWVKKHTPDDVLGVSSSPSGCVLATYARTIYEQEISFAQMVFLHKESSYEQRQGELLFITPSPLDQWMTRIIEVFDSFGRQQRVHITRHQFEDAWNTAYPYAGLFHSGLVERRSMKKRRRLL